MAFRFSILGSGSAGNGMLIENGRTLVLLDCGFSLRETRRRLWRLGVEAEQLTAILVTHEHSDHLSGVFSLAKDFKLPVYLTRGTWQAMPHSEDECACRIICAGLGFEIGDLQITPFSVPHDAAEPVQFVFSDGASRLAVLTDAGSVTGDIEKHLDACQALVLECNHEARMLQASPYPAWLKRRIGGGLGHLANHQAEELLCRIDTTRLQHIVGAHLSEKNNLPELAANALAAGLGCSRDGVAIADQRGGCGWRYLTG